MGYPIRSNLFRLETELGFSRFAIQVLLLFQPDDRTFVDHLDLHFLDLHRETGREVVFFAPLDPPSNWLGDSANRRWWTAYQDRFGKLNVSFDDLVLVRELSRLFGVELAELPVLIASPSFWRGDLVIVPTSAEVLATQLAALTGLARRVDAPSIDAMERELLAAGAGATLSRRLAADRKQQLGDFYEALEFLHPNRRSQLGESAFEIAAARVLGEVEQSLTASRAGGTNAYLGAVDEEAESRSDACLEDAAGKLIALATVAGRNQGLVPIGRPRAALDEESLVMLETAHRVGWLLNQMAMRGVPVDFTPGVQGAWKAFEREVNLSAIQAARGALGIEMPCYFGLYKQSFPCQVQTGPGRSTDLNKKDKLIAGQRQHKFITLGSAYHVTEYLLEDPERKLPLYLETDLGLPPIDPKLRRAWKRIYEIRNDGSHVEPLDRGQYDELLDLVRQPAVLMPLLEIKSKLRGHPMPEESQIG